MKTNMVKRLAAAMLAATVAIGTPMAVSAAWKTEGKGWNWTVNGQNATGWQMIDNTWYYFNAQGTMQTGWVQYGNSWFFLQPSGAMATGWVNDNGQYYYTKSNGAMATGWVQDNGTWYCMSSSGAMRTGWVASGNDWYYLAPTGAMVTSAVIKVDNAVYSIAADGSMQTGEVTIAGKTYTFGEDGAATGDNIPEPDRTFSSAATPGGTAAETTPTTPPADTTTPTTPSKPNRPSYGGGSNDNDSSSEPETPDITVQTVTVRPAGNADATPDYDYPAKYTAVGVGFSKTVDNEYTISYTPKQDVSIEDALCQTINGTKYGFIGLQFEKPEGAAKVSYTIAGGDATEVDLKGADAENLFKGNLILYFAFAKADKTTLAAGSWEVVLTWKDEAGETIVTRSATIKRAAADTDGDGGESSTPETSTPEESKPEESKPEESKPESSEPSSEPSEGSSGTDSQPTTDESSNSSDTTADNSQNGTPTQLNLINEIYESATPTNDGE